MQLNPDDFKIKPLQFLLCFISFGGVMFVALRHNFTLIGATLLSAGVIILLLLLEQFVIDRYEDRQIKKQREEENSD